MARLKPRALRLPISPRRAIAHTAANASATMTSIFFDAFSLAILQSRGFSIATVEERLLSEFFGWIKHEVLTAQRVEEGLPHQVQLPVVWGNSRIGEPLSNSG